MNLQLVSPRGGVMLFPLPLTPFESYYWYDNQPDYPTVFPIELTFSGELNREIFCSAVALVVARHPLLASRIQEDGAGRPAWIGGESSSIEVDWAAADVPITHPDGEWIDLRKAPGLRVWVRWQPAGSRVLLEFHHACCDGLAALRVVEELLLTYHQQFGGGKTTPELPPLDSERLQARGNFVEAAPGARTPLRDWWVGLTLWSKLLLGTPVPLALPATSSDTSPTASSNAANGKPPFLGFVTHTWSAAEAAQLRAAATALGGTLNDLLLRDLFLVLAAWNASHDRPRNSRFRINVPATLRGKEDTCMPAANALGFAFLTRSARDCRRPQDLFHSVRRETDAIKRYRLGLYFLGGLAVGCLLPGVLPRVLRVHRSFATAVLSNLGNVFVRTPLPRRDRKLVCGNTLLEHVRGAPPFRPLTRASFAVIHYAGVSEIHLRCDPRCFSAAQAKQLLGAYVAQLRASADPSSTTAPVIPSRV